MGESFTMSCDSSTHIAADSQDWVTKVARRPVNLLPDGRPSSDSLSAAAARGRWPSRNPSQENLAWLANGLTAPASAPLWRPNKLGSRPTERSRVLARRRPARGEPDLWPRQFGFRVGTFGAGPGASRTGRRFCCRGSENPLGREHLQRGPGHPDPGGTRGTQPAPVRRDEFHRSAEVGRL